MRQIPSSAPEPRPLKAHCRLILAILGFYYVLEKLSLDYQFDDGPFSAVFVKERGSGADDSICRTESNHTLIWIILNHRDTLVVLK